MKYLVLILLLSFTNVSLASGNKAQERELYNLLREDFRNNSTIAPKDTYFYHYLNLNLPKDVLEDPLLRKATFEKVRSQKVGSFWNLDSYDETNRVGPGMYYATDPLISEEYGKYFYQLKALEDVKVLDYEYYDIDPGRCKKYNKLFKSLKYALRLECGHENVRMVLDFNPGALTKRKCENKRSVSKALLAENIQLISYAFGSHMASICSKMNNVGGIQTKYAFILIGKLEKDPMQKINFDSFDFSIGSKEDAFLNLSDDEFVTSVYVNKQKKFMSSGEIDNELANYMYHTYKCLKD